MKIADEHRITEHGPSVGQHHGRDIPAYIVTAAGQKSVFVRTSTTDEDGLTPLSQLAANECVIAPGLIYRRSIEAFT